MHGESAGCSSSERKGQRTRPGRSGGKRGLGPRGLPAVPRDFGGGVGKKEWFAEVLAAGNWELWKAGSQPWCDRSAVQKGTLSSREDCAVAFSEP